MTKVREVGGSKFISYPSTIIMYLYIFPLKFETVNQPAVTVPLGRLSGTAGACDPRSSIHFVLSLHNTSLSTTHPRILLYLRCRVCVSIVCVYCGGVCCSVCIVCVFAVCVRCLSLLRGCVCGGFVCIVCVYSFFVSIVCIYCGCVRLVVLFVLC